MRSVSLIICATGLCAIPACKQPSLRMANDTKTIIESQHIPIHLYQSGAIERSPASSEKHVYVKSNIAKGLVEVDFADDYSNGVSDYRSVRRYVSDNGGRSWYRIRYDGFTDPIIDWGMHPADARTRYRLIRGYDREREQEELQIQVSYDDGKTWINKASKVSGTDVHVRQVNHIGFHPKRRDTIFISAGVPGSVIGGLLRIQGMFISENGGDSFRLLLGEYRGGFAISQSNPQVMLAVTIDSVAIISKDCGATWHAIGQDAVIKSKYGTVTQCVIDPMYDSRIYLIANTKILRSHDQGVNWYVFEFMHHDISVNGIVFDPYDRRTIFVGTNRGLLRSGDGGKTWICIDVENLSIGD